MASPEVSKTLAKEVGAKVELFILLKAKKTTKHTYNVWTKTLQKFLNL